MPVPYKGKPDAFGNYADGTSAADEQAKQKIDVASKAGLPTVPTPTVGQPVYTPPPAPQSGVAYGTPWGTTPPPPGTGTQATLGGFPTTPSYGHSADSTRIIERVGTPNPLDPGAFKIGGYDALQGGYGDAQQRLLQMQQGVGGMQENAAQSRALALGALTNPGPSQAQLQLQAGQQAATQNALAMARSGRGFGSAGQMQQATMQGSDALGQMNQQAAQLRAAETAQRNQQMLGLAGQDLGALGQQQQYTLGASGQGLQGLQQSGQLGYMQQQSAAEKAKADLQAQMQTQQTNAGYANYDAPPDTSGAQLAGSALGAASSLAMLPFLLSDERSKTKIQALEQENAALGGGSKPRPTQTGNAAGAFHDQRMGRGTWAERAREGATVGHSASRASALGSAPAGGILDRFAALPGYSYEYKNPGQPGAAPGPQVGPMAGDLAKTLPGTVARGAGPGGMDMVDPGRLALANTAATSELARKLKALGV